MVSWYQFTTNCGYKDVAKLCLNFIKWNFDVVSESIDWPNLELDSLIQVKSDSYLKEKSKEDLLTIFVSRCCRAVTW